MIFYVVRRWAVACCPTGCGWTGLFVLQIHEEACTNYVFWNYSSTEYTSWIQKI